MKRLTKINKDGSISYIHNIELNPANIAELLVAFQAVLNSLAEYEATGVTAGRIKELKW